MSGRRRAPTVLVICDGWGVGATDRAEARRRGDAVALARTPVRNRLLATRPWSLLETSGEAVGLPAGRMGNSEVGHLNLGAGRVVRQDVTRIDQSIRDGSFFRLAPLDSLAATLRRTGGRLHLLGLCSDAGVHSRAAHLRALLTWAHGIQARDAPPLPVRVHCVTDGRDAPPTSGAEWAERVEAWTAELPDARVASVAGRYFAMDRDQRWSRTRQAYQAIAAGTGLRVERASRHVRQCYDAGTTDEFVQPAVVVAGRRGASPESPGIAPEDGVVFFNFRADRARQLAAALTEPGFRGFARNRSPCRHLVAMTRYEDDFAHPVLFPSRRLDNVLGEVLARAGRTQLRAAETEKYAHVTYFFNGGEEAPFPGEDRCMVRSPQVDTYDLKPEMSAPELTDALLSRLDERRHDFILVNYANADMVGHTGNIAAAAAAVETVDACVGRVLDRVAALGGTALVAADHGNAERMLDEDGRPFTAHTTGPVRLFLAVPGEPGADAPATPVGRDPNEPSALRDGVLADVAPTVLALMGIDPPPEMTGRSLLAGRSA